MEECTEGAAWQWWVTQQKLRLETEDENNLEKLLAAWAVSECRRANLLWATIPVKHIVEFSFLLVLVYSEEQIYRRFFCNEC